MGPRRSRRGRVILCSLVFAVLGLALTACGTSPKAPSKTSTKKSTVEVTLARALRELAQKNFAPAVADFLAVVKADPANHVAWFDLGVIAQQAGQYTQAANDYISSLGHDPRYVPALYNLAILETPTHPKTAAELYQKAIAVEPNDAEAHLNLGFVFDSLGEDQAGYLQFLRAVKLDPSLHSRVPKAPVSG
jgi:Tfp pilus assembly protein PilF